MSIGGPSVRLQPQLRVRTTVCYHSMNLDDNLILAHQHLYLDLVSLLLGKKNLFFVEQARTGIKNELPL